MRVTPEEVSAVSRRIATDGHRCSDPGAAEIDCDFALINAGFTDPKIDRTRATNLWRSTARFEIDVSPTE